MKSAWSVLLLCLTGVTFILMAVDPSRAMDENRVAVVVDFGNGQVATKCISFPEESISGFEALQRSGLPVETDFQTGGAAICRIDGRGCPSEDCFCECRGGGECKYWSYWHFINASWNYSVAGSGIYQVRDGAVDGWVWGLGSITQATPPPEISFAEVCVDGSAASPTATSTTVPTSTPMILPTLAPPVSASSLTPTVQVSMPTAIASIAASPTAPLTEIASPTSFPAFGSQINTPIPETAIEANAALITSTTSAQDFEPFPSQLSSDTQLTPMPATIAPTQSSADSGPAIAPTQEAVAEFGVDIGLSSNSLPSEPVKPTATPGVVAAVIGKDAPMEEPLPGTFSVHSKESSSWVPYTGFAGLLILLGALGMLVYRRRETCPGRNEL